MNDLIEFQMPKGNRGQRPSINLPSLLLSPVEAPVKSFNTALSVDYALLTRIKGVAIAADFNTQLGLGGPGLKDVTAGTGHRGVEKSRVNVSLHADESSGCRLSGWLGLFEGINANTAATLGSPLVFDLAVSCGK